MTRDFTAPELERYRAAHADRVRSLRRRLRLTQGQLALLLGIDRRTLIRWEGGQSGPSSSALVVLRAVEVEGMHESALALVRAGGLFEVVRRALERERTKANDRNRRRQ